MTPAARDDEDAELDLELTMAARGLFGALFDEIERAPEGPPEPDRPTDADRSGRETRNR
ncbi:MAG: hypothetical protein HOV66_11245 [Streptomycetaceae bacterium]|nr:hypothetical protein [Streptomycetaceae bacterium]NUS55417.1 hypothetical protein [Streptomycetaceae bacterium]